ncbi:MAG: HNH endonuclease [Lachnospiraceae bacterium]|nr:HNH endonuclease [Lachnospiraceae bacterium]
MKILPTSSEVDATMFPKMIADTTASYKLYWLYAITEEIIHNHTEITFHRLVCRMISFAWYPVCEYHLDFGFFDQLGNIIALISEKNIIQNNELPDKILEAVEAIEDKEICKKIEDLYRNVPFKLLSAFIKDAYPNTKVSTWKDREVIEFSQTNEHCFYSIHKEDGILKICIREKWFWYIYNNQSIMKDWIKYHIVLYLQGKNPNVPAIPLKIEPQREDRNLSKQWKFWNLVRQSYELRDFYVGNILLETHVRKEKPSLDHFIPWKFVMHNELWNLVPVAQGINSSKSDTLPDLNKHLEHFCDVQYSAFDIVRASGKLKPLLEDYHTIHIALTQDKNGNYKRVEKETFCNALKSTIVPLHQIALNQGYKVGR